MRLARDFGTVSELFPEGISDLRDLPHALFDMVRRALVFLGFEELPQDERPPRRIWLDTERLREWFDEVRAKREREYGGDREYIENPVENEAAKDLIVG